MLNEKNKNIELTDEEIEKQVGNYNAYQPSRKERRVLKFFEERFQAMEKRKKELSIDYKCALYDRLYTPHRILKIAEQDQDKEFEQSHLRVDDEDGRKSNKSRPLAFEKVQTAISIMISKNPQALLEAYCGRHKALNEIVKQAYEKNWEQNRLIIQLRKFTFHLAKYGIAYGRRYIKQKFKVIHTEDGRRERVLSFYDTIFDTMHPKNVFLDENCDNPRNARDCIFVYEITRAELLDEYPEELYPNVKFVHTGRWLNSGQSSRLDDANGVLQKDESNIVQLAVYENEPKDIRLIISGNVLLTPFNNPLPGHQLSLVGEKWAEKDESYDGIGICQVLENYLPLIDDIANADIDLVREIIRPTLYKNVALQVSDEQEEDDIDGQRVVNFEGDINQMRWDRPPRDGQAVGLLEYLGSEAGKATGIADDVSSISGANTLGQASFNRENSLRRLSLPLEAIKYAVEDDARKALPLLKIVNSKPIKTYYIENKKELEEAMTILQENPDDERFVLMPEGKIVRRKFKEVEFGLNYDAENQVFVGAESKNFWELIPSTFDWEGTINIIPMSFLPKSEAMETAAALQDLNILLGIQAVDPMTGLPTLIDNKGQAFKINKLELVKNYINSRNKDKNKLIIPYNPEMPEGNIVNSTMTNPKNLQPTTGEKLGLPAGA